MTTNGYLRGVKESGWTPYAGRLWQRNYYERVLRDEDELHHAREYVARNPGEWLSDAHNPNTDTTIEA